MFFTKLFSKKLRAMRRKKQTVSYWGAPKQSYTFGSAFMDGFMGMMFAAALIYLAAGS